MISICQFIKESGTLSTVLQKKQDSDLSLIMDTSDIFWHFRWTTTIPIHPSRKGGIKCHSWRKTEAHCPVLWHFADTIYYEKEAKAAIFFVEECLTPFPRCHFHRLFFFKLNLYQPRRGSFKCPNPPSTHQLITSWWFQPLWKILVKIGIFPKVRGENKKYLKPPPRSTLQPFPLTSAPPTSAASFVSSRPSAKRIVFRRSFRRRRGLPGGVAREKKNTQHKIPLVSVGFP